MAAFKEVRTAAVQALRSSAARCGESAVAFGQQLRGFGAGDVGAGDLANSGLNLVLRNAYGAVEDSIDFSTAYWNWASALVGISRPVSDIAPAGPAPSAPATDETSKAVQ